MDMSGDILVRLALSGDVDGILSIGQQVHEVVVANRAAAFGPPPEFAGQAGFYADAIEDDRCLLLVAEVSGVLAGYVHASVETEPDDLTTVPRISINEIAIDRQFQGLGAGEVLIERVHTWARERGHRIVQLAVWAFNHRAIGFYQTLGYRFLMHKMEIVLE